MATDVAEERVRLLACLGKTKDEQARSKAAEFVISVRVWDIFYYEYQLNDKENGFRYIDFLNSLASR